MDVGSDDDATLTDGKKMTTTGMVFGMFGNMAMGVANQLNQVQQDAVRDGFGRIETAKNITTSSTLTKLIIFFLSFPSSTHWFPTFFGSLPTFTDFIFG